MKHSRALAAAVITMLLAGVASLTTHARPTAQHLRAGSQTGDAGSPQSTDATGGVVDASNGAAGSSTASTVTPGGTTTSLPPAGSAVSTTSPASDQGTSPPPASPAAPPTTPSCIPVGVAPDPATPPPPPTPIDPRVTPFCQPTYQSPVEIITSGGYLWGEIEHFIVRMTPTGDVTKFPLPFGVQPRHMSPGPDGRLWFVDAASRQVGYMTPGGTVTTFPATPSGPVEFTDSAIGDDGGLWFTIGGGPEFGYGAIGHVTPTGAVTIQPLGTMTLTGLARGPDGSLWVLDMATVHHLAADGTDSPIPMPDGWWALGKPAWGQDGALWIHAEHQGDLTEQLFRLSAAGSFTPVALPSGFIEEYVRMAAGPDGNLWISDLDRGSLLRFSPSGALIDEIGVGDRPTDITVGPDGNIWFTAPFSIGRVVV